MGGRRRADEATARLVQAWRARDAGVLAGLLHPSVVLTADGLDGVAHAPVRGATAVAETLLRLTTPPAPGELSAAIANGVPAVVVHSSGTTRGVVVVEVRRGLVTRLWAVFNPLKLSTWR